MVYSGTLTKMIQKRPLKEVTNRWSLYIYFAIRNGGLVDKIKVF